MADKLLVILKLIFRKQYKAQVLVEPPISYLNISSSNSEWNKASVAFAKSKELMHSKDKLTINYPKQRMVNKCRSTATTNLSTSDWNKLLLSKKKPNKQINKD